MKSKHKPKQERKQNTSTHEQTAKQPEKHLTERTYADVVRATDHQKRDTQRLNRRHSQTRISQSPVQDSTRHSHRNKWQQNKERSRG